MLAFSSRYLTKWQLENFDLESLYQGHGVQHSLLFRSIANINLYKSRSLAFIVSAHRFRDINISKFQTLKMYVKVMMHSIRSHAIRLQIDG